MKRVWSCVVLLVLSVLLCACGGAEDTAQRETPAAATELPDARELWKKADELAADWDCVDADLTTVVSADLQGLKQTYLTETRIKGNGLLGESPVYQAVSTGDLASEAYFSDGWLYVSGEFGSYKQKTTEEQMVDYLGDGGFEFSEESFEDVSLVSSENGWKLAFSGPREEFVTAFLETVASEEQRYKEGSLEIVGGIQLLEDGSLSRIAVDMSAIFLVEEEEILINVVCEEQIHGHEDVRITLPSKLKSYAETGDVRIPEMLYNAFLQLEMASAVEFEAKMGFDGDLGGNLSALEEGQRGYMMIEPEQQAPHYYSEWINWVNSAEQQRYTIDYKGDTAYYERDTFATEVKISLRDIWAALDNDLYCYCSAGEMAYYTNMQMEESDNGSVIRFAPSEELQQNLLDYYMACYMNGNDYDDFAEDSTYEFKSSSGVVRLDAEGRLLSMEFTADISRTAVSGRTVDGTLTYEKIFHAYDDAVSMPGDESGEVLSVA